MEERQNLSQVCSVTQQLEHLQKQIEALQAQQRSVCASFTITQLRCHNSKMCWDVDNVSCELLPKQNENTEVKIQLSGTYFISVQVLNKRNINTYPVLYINHVGKQFGYGCGEDFHKGTIAVALSLNQGDILSVGFQSKDENHNVFDDIYATHHTFSIFKI